MKATSVRAHDSNSKSNQNPEPKAGNQVTTDYFEMKLCLGGCGKTINVKAPWGRFVNGGVCGITCNETYLRQRTENLMTRTA